MDRSAFDAYLGLEERHFWRVAKRRLIAGLVEERFAGRSGLHLVDIGGACSLISQVLQPFGEVESIEPDAEIAEVARSRLGIRVHHGALPNDLPHVAPAHVVTLLDVLEHIEDDFSALVTVRRALTPDGVLFVTVPALRWLWSDHDVVLGHHRRYTRAGLANVLGRAGFKIERLSYYTSLLFPVVVLQRMVGMLRPNDPHPSYRVKVPPRPINTAMGVVMSVERRLLASLDLPIGSSLFAVARPHGVDVVGCVRSSNMRSLGS